VSRVNVNTTDATVGATGYGTVTARSEYPCVSRLPPCVCPGSPGVFLPVAPPGVFIPVFYRYRYVCVSRLRPVSFYQYNTFRQTKEPNTGTVQDGKARAARRPKGRATQEEYARHTPMCSVSGARAMRLRKRRHCSRREAPVRFPGETPSWRPLHRRGKSIALGTSCAESSPPACMAASQAQGIVWERSTICRWRL